MPIRFMLITFLMTAMTGCGIDRPRTPQSYIERRSQGNVRQTHQYSCGAASLATLMKSFDVVATETELLAEVFASDPKARIVGQPDETSELYLDPLTVKNLEDLARKRGFKVLSLQALAGHEAAASLETLSPCITRLKLYGDTLHFVVVHDMRHGFVHVSDPSYGNYRVPLRQFRQAWEAGDRIIVAISRRPFLVWEDEEGGLYVKRDSDEVITRDESPYPVNLYQSARRAVTLTNSIVR